VLVLDVEVKSTKRAERRVYILRDKAKRTRAKEFGRKAWLAEREARRLARNPIASQPIFDLIVDELLTNAA
jgi:hypothetical protein